MYFGVGLPCIVARHSSSFCVMHYDLGPLEHHGCCYQRRVASNVLEIVSTERSSANAERVGTVNSVAQILSYMVEVIGLFFIMAASVGLGYLIHQGEVSMSYTAKQLNAWHVVLGLHPEAAPIVPMIGFAMTLIKDSRES